MEEVTLSTRCDAQAAIGIAPVAACAFDDERCLRFVIS